jgi:CTP-dependent riboflavin kinase
MNKKDFQKAIMNAAKEVSLTDISNLMKVSIKTAERWYQGLSAPHELGRDIAIEALYREIRDRKEEKLFNERIKKYLSENLKIEVKEEGPYYAGDPVSINIKVKLGGSVIAEDWASLYPGQFY